jgi:hypothetical protein
VPGGQRERGGWEREEREREREEEEEEEVTRRDLKGPLISKHSI